MDVGSTAGFMAGDILETMAKAVVNANAVIVVVSQNYEQSQNCRTEASLAYRRKRKIIPIMAQGGYHIPAGCKQGFWFFCCARS